jgi:3,4-dihydroxy 2-butanone 4-phosphate synthase/GTP cyclohydrolase II
MTLEILHDPYMRVKRALDDFKSGRMIILMDDEDRENEGDLAIAAEKISPEAINFMSKNGRGLICLALTDEKVESLKLPMMVADNESRFQTGFTVSIEARSGVTTGISAYDRAHTILTAISDDWHFHQNRWKSLPSSVWRIIPGK